ncbi:MAG: pyridoxamine 5'-phosphate oxidase family protein [Candidatus Azobacteroides sp.]|nr:pyridoxamine 5'-phosphate oxidase family protein [Candidatus Azobacteroides sp.]
MKTIQDCIQFTNANPVCYLATIENDRPRVRALGFWFADETGFYFQTASVKEIPAQLQQNPNVEVCFYKPEQGLGTMLRIAGKTEFLNERKYKEKALEDRPFLKEFGMTADSEELVLFYIPHGEAYFWTMEDNLKPKVKIEF